MAKSKFVVSPVAQHEFRVLGGGRPTGANERARAALELAHAESLAREQARQERAAARAAAKHG